MRTEIVEVDPLNGVDYDSLCVSIQEVGMVNPKGIVHLSFIDRVYANRDHQMALIISSERVDDAERLFDMVMDPL